MYKVRQLLSKREKYAVEDEGTYSIVEVTRYRGDLPCFEEGGIAGTTCTCGTMFECSHQEAVRSHLVAVVGPKFIRF